MTLEEARNYIDKLNTGYNFSIEENGYYFSVCIINESGRNICISSEKLIETFERAVALLIKYAVKECYKPTLKIKKRLLVKDILN